ncbi:DUF2891 family protein [Enterobacter asburiae]|uniref:DUF2891 family protein n=1 Tax=Enterobacter asburiae TaxID=61645 RepID=UPI003C75DAAB
MELTQHQADAFARMPLTYLRQEYPNHIMHLLNDDGDVLPPRELHPVFYGCFDWHSAVHGYWLLLRCLRPVSDTHPRPHETRHYLVSRLLLVKKNDCYGGSYRLFASLGKRGC